MGPFSILFLVLQLFFNSPTSSKVLSSPLNAVNSVNDKLNDYSVLLPPELSDDNNDLIGDDGDFPALHDLNDTEDVPEIQTFDDKTELKFHQSIQSVNIDYSRNAIVLKFYKNNAKSLTRLTSKENENKKSVKDNFMRFVKKTIEEYPSTNSFDTNHGMRTERSHQTARDARGDNFMRFGRADNVKNDFMRFGRSVGQDIMRFGRTPTKDFMRFGRAGQDNFIRFGRNPNENFMRFGRHIIKLPKNTNFVRYARPDNFMRFGRTSPHNADNFMRFGKSIENSNDKNTSQTLMDKNELKQAVKLIHEFDKSADNENPVDKAIKVLFDRHQQQNAADNTHSEELYDNANHQHTDNNDLEPNTDYFLKASA